RQVKMLKVDATARRSWSLKTEKSKHQSADSGFVGAIAAKIMKRALHAERRKDQKLGERQEILKSYEKTRYIQFVTHPKLKTEAILNIRNLSYGYGDNANLVNQLFLELMPRERIAIIGNNGVGKSSFLNLLLGRNSDILEIREGSIQWKKNIKTLYINQVDPYHRQNFQCSLSHFSKDQKFIDTLACLGMNISRRKLDDHPFSPGELKKIEIAKSLSSATDLLIWDEALANLDLPTREAIEKLLIQSQQSMIFVEHDQTFIKRVASQIIEL
ncbi:ATP-binding cassette domain-containing protein, partial [bacterium]|nr:ATP-binding cassette domain-containing protein [bacterium]